MKKVERIVIDPKDQFSKKLAKWSAWFYFLYMPLVLAAIVLEPESSDAAVYLAGFVALVMLLNIASYTRNSVYDKALAAGAEVLGKFRFTWKGNRNQEEDLSDITEEEDIDE